MSRALITIRGAADRARACNWIAKAPHGTRVIFKAARRTLPQNDRFWATLTDVADQVEWCGLKLKASDWRLIFLDALKRERIVVPNIDGSGLVDLGQSSSDLTKNEMSELLELITAFGAQHGVVFHDPTVPADEREREVA